MPGGQIFISYRRADSQWAASRLYDSLTQVFPDERLFMDVDSIDPGQDFVDVLADKVGRADVFLALIGPDWLTETTASGMRRIDDAQDFVRIEIASALSQADTVVIPVLLDGATPPTEADLPEPLRPLARRHFARLTHEGYRGEIDRLVDGIRKALELRPADADAVPAAASAAAPRPPVLTGKLLARLGAGVAAALVVAAVAWVVTRPPDPADGADLSAFKECAACPEMVILPAGEFVMGSPEDEANRLAQEGPTRAVKVARFAIARTEVTFDQWDACVADGGCRDFTPADRGDGRIGYPAYNLSWNDAQAYVVWLNRQVPGAPYRLPTEAEWEYAARAGTATAYYWGDAPDRAFANMGREVCCIGAAEGPDEWVGAAPAASFQPNAFGLHDMAGNVWEWVEDLYRKDYDGAPTDGSEWTTDSKGGVQGRRTLRGGSYKDRPWQVRSAMRVSNDPDWRLDIYGFRPARSLSGD